MASSDAESNDSADPCFARCPWRGDGGGFYCNADHHPDCRSDAPAVCTGFQTLGNGFSFCGSSILHRSDNIHDPMVGSTLSMPIRKRTDLGNGTLCFPCCEQGGDGRCFYSGGSSAGTGSSLVSVLQQEAKEKNLTLMWDMNSGLLHLIEGAVI